MVDAPGVEPGSATMHFGLSPRRNHIAPTHSLYNVNSKRHALLGCILSRVELDPLLPHRVIVPRPTLTAGTDKLNKHSTT